MKKIDDMKKKMVVCSACDSEHLPSDMMAEPKEIGSDVQTVMICKTCSDLAISETLEGKTAPTFHPLEGSQERDRKHDEWQGRKTAMQAKVLNQYFVHPDLRQEEPTLKCHECGKHHGQYGYSKKHGQMRVNVIVKAWPLDFNVSPVVVEAICNDCLALMKAEAQTAGVQINFHPVVKSYDLMEQANQSADAQKLRDEETKQRLQKIAERDMYYPKGDPRRSDSSRRGTGTHGR